MCDIACEEQAMSLNTENIRINSEIVLTVTVYNYDPDASGTA